MRYKSKKALYLASEADNDPFQGRYYLSYIDVRSGLTIYGRNHASLDSLFAKLLPKYQSLLPSSKSVSTIPQQTNCESPEMTNTSSQKVGLITSGNADLSSFSKDTETTNREDTENDSSRL